MTSEIIFLVENVPGAGFSARALGYSIFTGAGSEGELRTMVTDAVNCHFDEGEAPEFIRLVRVEDGAVARGAVRSRFTPVSRMSRGNGVWMNCTERLPLEVPRPPW